ncbi:MAG TPA: hypothetical protein VF221_17535 [Chloroflexota bacterium]
MSSRAWTFRHVAAAFLGERLIFNYQFPQEYLLDLHIAAPSDVGSSASSFPVYSGIK